MTSTRERLERRWTPGRIVLLVVGIVVALVVVAAVVALWWLPPVLAETPRERFAAPTPVTVTDASGSAGVEVASGWVPLGVGPFLSADTATLLSPDGVYRAELGLAPLPDAGDAAVSAALSAVLAAHSLGDAAAADAAGSAGAPTAARTDADAGAPTGPGTGAPAPTDAATADPVAPRDAPADRIRWSEETLTSGATVRYADLVRGDTTYTVAIVLPPASDPAAAPPAVALTLVAEVPSADAAAYRTVTADLVASATFARPATGSPTAPTSSISPSASEPDGDR